MTQMQEREYLGEPVDQTAPSDLAPQQLDAQALNESPLNPERQEDQRKIVARSIAALLPGDLRYSQAMLLAQDPTADLGSLMARIASSSDG